MRCSLLHPKCPPQEAKHEKFEARKGPASFPFSLTVNNYRWQVPHWHDRIIVRREVPLFQLHCPSCSAFLSFSFPWAHYGCLLKSYWIIICGLFLKECDICLFLPPLSKDLSFVRCRASAGHSRSKAQVSEPHGFTQWGSKNIKQSRYSAIAAGVTISAR